MKLLLIDNYDSFTYLLAQYFEELDCSVTVVFYRFFTCIILIWIYFE